MKALGELFASAARTEVLRALHHQPDGVGLRPLARIAGLHVRSAELALRALVNEKIVTRTRKANRVFYAIDRADPRSALLGAAFQAAAVAAIKVESPSFEVPAKRILPCIRQAAALLRHARRERP